MNAGVHAGRQGSVFSLHPFVRIPLTCQTLLFANASHCSDLSRGKDHLYVITSMSDEVMA